MEYLVLLIIFIAIFIFMLTWKWISCSFHAYQLECWRKKHERCHQYNTVKANSFSELKIIETELVGGSKEIEELLMRAGMPIPPDLAVAMTAWENQTVYAVQQHFETAIQRLKFEANSFKRPTTWPRIIGQMFVRIFRGPFYRNNEKGP